MKACFFPGITIGAAGTLGANLTVQTWGVVGEGANIQATDSFIATIVGYVATAGVNSLERKGFHFVSRRADGSLDLSPVIKLSEITKITKLSYNAGTAQVLTITPVLPGTQKKGDAYTIKLIDISAPSTIPMTRKNFQVVHVGIDFTTTTLCDAFRTLINANIDLLITGTGVATLILTGNNPEVAFASATDDLGSAFTTVLTTKNIPSVGTLVKVLALEQECNSYQFGVWNKVLFDKPAPSKVQPGETTFDICIVEFAKPVQFAAGVKGAYVSKLYIVEKSGAVTPPSSFLPAN